MKNAKIILIFIVGVTAQLFSQEESKLFVHNNGTNGFDIHCTLKEYGSIYKISKVYHVSIENILRYNKLKTAENIGPEQVIKISLEKDLIKGKAGKGTTPVYYKVTEGETLYRIARTYLNQDLNEFITRNNLGSHSLKKEAILNLGFYNFNLNIPENPKEESTAIHQMTKDTTDKIAQEVVLPEVVYIRQKGIAFVNGKGSNGEGGMYVLHADAKINSEIELHNPMIGRTVKAKVVGRIPEGTYNSDINVVLSSATAKSLGALDSRFRVEIKYIQ
jgi:LysM repeat protein